MDKKELAEVFNDSFQRCLANDDFVDRFYDRFINSDQQVARKFSGTEMENQKIMLKASLYTLMSASLGTPSAVENIREIGRVHSRTDRNIDPALYSLWMKSLLETVAEYDSRYSEKVETAWRQTLRSGIEVMQSEY